MNVCSTNRPKTPKKRGQPNKFTIAQLVDEFTQKNMTAEHERYLRSLTCIEDYVYLHSPNGPLEGAKKVLTAMKKKNVTTVNGNTIPINKLRSGTRIPKSNFDPDLSALDSKSIEHFLCINHSYNII